MKKGRKRVLSAWLAVLLLLLTIFPGCGENQNGETSKNTVSLDEKITLTLVTEASNARSWRLDTQLYNVIKYFRYRLGHANVKIEVIRLPVLPGEREIVLQQMKTEIIAGGGPDMFLIPSQDLFVNYTDEQLFSDVSQAMRNGLFADISEYYDADDELGKDGLITAVMDAGVVDGGRYVLPLRYNIPVAYVNKTALEAAGLNEDLFLSGADELMESIIQIGDSDLAGDARLLSVMRTSVLSRFPEVIDYDNQEIALSKEELTDFMRLYQTYEGIRAGKNGYTLLSDIGSYIQTGDSFVISDHMVTVDNASLAIPNAAVAKHEGVEIDMYPIRATDGSVNAEITYYAAIGAGCESPELAYEFIRLFLLEDSQWESNAKNVGWDLAAYSWPVRAQGAPELLYRNLLEIEKGIDLEDQAKERREAMGKIQLSDADIPFMQYDITKAHFPLDSLENELGLMIVRSLADTKTGNALDADIDALADEWLRKLEFHLYEG